MIARIDQEAYRLPNGRYDYAAYDLARVQNGDFCSSCLSWLVAPKGFPELCYDCKSMKEDLDEVSHDEYLRCPFCREEEEVCYMEDYSLYQDGPHEITCTNCGKEYEITTNVSYSFVSPAICKEESDTNT